MYSYLKIDDHKSIGLQASVKTPEVF